MKREPRFARSCGECGIEFMAAKAEAQFCGDACRQTFKNRRLLRGSALYDLFMVMRYQRGVAKAIGAWAIICRMAQDWRAEDERVRAGRPSWQAPEALDLTRYRVKVSQIRPGR